MREINITNDVIELLQKMIKSKSSTNAMLKAMALKGWNESCNDWNGFVNLLEERNLDKIFTDYEFFIRY